MTWKTYCGNLLWQSGLTLLVPVGSDTLNKPVEGVRVLACFTSRYARWENATENVEFSEVTDKTGKLSFSGKTNCGDVGFRTLDMADYYAVPWVSIPLTGRGRFHSLIGNQTILLLRFVFSALSILSRFL